MGREAGNGREHEQPADLTPVDLKGVRQTLEDLSREVRVDARLERISLAIDDALAALDALSSGRRATVALDRLARLPEGRSLR